MKKSVCALLFMLVIQLASTTPAFAQCQNQYCAKTGTGDCFGCIRFDGFACSPGIGRCPKSCTNTFCSAAAAQGSTDKLVMGSSPSSLQPLSDACVAQMAKDNSLLKAEVPQEPASVSTFAQWQNNSPVNIISWTVALDKDSKFLVKRVVIENLDASLVIEYQLGWMLIFADREPEIHLLDPIATKLESKGVMEIGEPLPVYSMQDNESVAESKQESFVSSPRTVVPAVTQTPDLKAINVFVAAVKREGSPEFHANVNELSTQLKARFNPTNATAN